MKDNKMYAADVKVSQNAEKAEKAVLKPNECNCAYKYTKSNADGDWAFYCNNAKSVRYGCCCRGCDMYENENVVAERERKIKEKQELLAKIVNSDSDCCYTCTLFHYDMTKRADICEVSGKEIKVYNPACCNYKRRLQGFGE